jgi:hypothetical protein
VAGSSVPPEDEVDVEEHATRVRSAVAADAARSVRKVIEALR